MGLPADKSKDFSESGMTLITQIESERYLNVNNKKIEKKLINKKEL